MIKNISNACSDFLEWKDEVLSRQSEWLNHQWNYYTKERAILQGLPIAIITSIATAYLFQCTRPVTALIFGAVNYLAVTTLLEIMRTHHKIDRTQACILLTIGGAMSVAFIQTVCKTSMTYQAAILLTIAAFSGQLARQFFSTEDY